MSPRIGDWWEGVRLSEKLWNFGYGKNTDWSRIHWNGEVVLSQMSEEKQTAFQFLSALFKVINHADYITSVTDERMCKKYWWN
jgi:hypothetical protein